MGSRYLPVHAYIDIYIYIPNIHIIYNYISFIYIYLSIYIKTEEKSHGFPSGACSAPWV